jgi:hypothetical protein
MKQNRYVKKVRTFLRESARTYVAREDVKTRTIVPDPLRDGYGATDLIVAERLVCVMARFRGDWA